MVLRGREKKGEYGEAYIMELLSSAICKYWEEAGKRDRERKWAGVCVSYTHSSTCTFLNGRQTDRQARQ